MVAKTTQMLDEDFTPAQVTSAAASQSPEGLAKLDAANKKTAGIKALTQQILGQGLTGKWSGEGYGSVDKNAEAMAKLMADAGITDIRQFGKVDKYEPVEVLGYTLNGKDIQNPSKGVYYEQIPIYDGEGGIQSYQRRNLTPQEAAQVQPKYGVVDERGDEGNPSVVRPATNVVERDGKLVGVTGQTFGNKATGQEIVRGAGRWQNQGGEDLFSGTGEGKGNTAFRVQFRDDGTPVFYTTQGSSSDLADIAPLLTIASFVPGLQPFAAGLNALIAAKQGNVLGAIAGAAGLGGYSDVANAARLGSALQSGDPLAIALAGANVGGVTDVGGVKLSDISRSIGAAKAIESGDPLALMRYGMGAMSPDGKLTSSFGPGTAEEFSEGLIPGYFQPGGEGYISSADEHVFDPTYGGSMPLTEDDVPELVMTDRRDKTQEHVFDPTFGGMLPQPEADIPEFVMTAKRDKTQEHVFDPTFGGSMPLPDGDIPELVMTDKRDKTQEHVFDPTFGGSMPLPTTPGATPGITPRTPTTPKTPASPTTPTASSGMDMMGLMALLGGQQQPVQQAPMQDPYAHIKLMEDLFGSSLDLTPTGNSAA